MASKQKAYMIRIALLVFIVLISGSMAYAQNSQKITSEDDVVNFDENIVEGIKGELPDVPYKNEGIVVLFPTYIGMMVGGLVGLPIGMAVVIPAGIVGSGIFPIVLYETGRDPVSDNPVPTGSKLAVTGAKPIIYLAYGLGYVVGFPFLAVKKILYDLPKSLVYDPFHPEIKKEPVTN